MCPAFAQYAIRVNSCGAVLREPDWVWPYRRGFRDYDLIFTWMGEGWAQQHGEEMALHPGTLELLRPATAYFGANPHKDWWGVFFFHFDFLDTDGRIVYPADDELPPRCCRLREFDFVEQLLRQAIRLVLDGGELPRKEAEQYLRAVLLKALLEASLQEEPPVLREQRTRIAEVIRYIREHPEGAYSVAELAERANYSPDHFSRVFKMLHGINPKEFCIRTRIERARHLLAETHLPVERIATQLGYADIFFFSRQFKQRVGFSPRRWRELCHSGRHPTGRQPAAPADGLTGVIR